MSSCQESPANSPGSDSMELGDSSESDRCCNAYKSRDGHKLERRARLGLLQFPGERQKPCFHPLIKGSAETWDLYRNTEVGPVWAGASPLSLRDAFCTCGTWCHGHQRQKMKQPGCHLCRPRVPHPQPDLETRLVPERSDAAGSSLCFSSAAE